MQCWELSSIIPVSYTHLDVYKRQEYGREKSCGGFMLYSWDYLDIPETEAELQQMEELWTK